MAMPKSNYSRMTPRRGGTPPFLQGTPGKGNPRGKSMGGDRAPMPRGGSTNMPTPSSDPTPMPRGEPPLQPGYAGYVSDGQKR